MKIEGLAASFDLESYGLEPTYGVLLCGVVKPWGGPSKLFRVKQVSSDDSKLTTELVTELNKYAILIAHNGVFYDRKMLNARALKFNLPILDPRGKMIDPVQIARRHLNMRRNSLDALADYFGLSEQKMHIPAEVWVRAGLDHSKADLDLICERCESDVRVLEELATRVLGLVGSVNFWGSA